MAKPRKIQAFTALLLLAWTPPLLAAEAEAEPDPGQGTLRLRAVTTAGDPIEAAAALRSPSGMSVQVSGDGSHALDPGEYPMRVGVETRNGSLYRPVARTVEIVAGQETVVDVKLEKPPSVSVRFLEDGQEVQEEGPDFDGQVYAYQDDRQVFHFNWQDTVYLEEGEYSFHASPNRRNVDLTVRETFEPGDHKLVTFVMKNDQTGQ